MEERGRSQTGLVAAVGVFAVMLIAGGSSTIYHRVHQDDAPAAAPGGTSVQNCHEALRTDLRSSTVNFHPLSEKVAEFDAGWRITGTLDAQNGSGMKTESDYACVTEADGAVMTHVLSPAVEVQPQRS
jgi:hypothetical protein